MSETALFKGGKQRTRSSRKAGTEKSVFVMSVRPGIFALVNDSHETNATRVRPSSETRL